MASPNWRPSWRTYSVLTKKNVWSIEESLRSTSSQRGTCMPFWKKYRRLLHFLSRSASLCDQDCLRLYWPSWTIRIQTFVWSALPCLRSWPMKKSHLSSHKQLPNSSKLSLKTLYGTNYSNCWWWRFQKSKMQANYQMKIARILSSKNLWRWSKICLTYNLRLLLTNLCTQTTLLTCWCWCKSEIANTHVQTSFIVLRVLSCFVQSSRAVTTNSSRNLRWH